MAYRKFSQVVAASLVIMTAALAPAGGQVCSPEVDGRVADVRYGDTTIDWFPLVEYDRMVLRIGGPCEDIVKVFERGQPISFDIAEIVRVQDGVYVWELRREAPIDPSTQKSLNQSRVSGDASIWWQLWLKGSIPQGPYLDSETFEVSRGLIVPRDQIEDGGTKDAVLAESGIEAASNGRRNRTTSASVAAIGGADSVLTPVTAEAVLSNSDGVVRNSLCVGFDCPDNPSFSDTTILLMEHNTRIKFDDTSVTAGFPTNDWELEANSSLSGGGNYFAINDCSNSSQGGCADDPVFKIESGARANALYVESDGDIGIGTANPVVRIHATDGDTPALRLDQDNSSGFEPQVWDVAGNETNFFIRDVTGGSLLPFRIRPSAPSNSIFIDTNGNVGLGTSSPSQELTIKSDTANQNVVEVKRSQADSQTILRVFETTNGDGLMSLFNSVAGETFRFTGSGGTNWLSGTVGINCNSAGGFDFAVKNGTSSTTACNAGTFSGLNAGNTTFTVASSRTMKRNLEPVRVPDILDKLTAVDVYTYDFIEGPSDMMGLVAEDFHTIFGRGSEKLINGQEVEMALWLAVKALAERNDQLTKRLAELESRLVATAPR